MTAFTPSRWRRGTAGLAALALAGVLAAGCSAGSPAVTPPTAVPTGGQHPTTTTTAPATSSTLPECGATRDPLDPTDSSAPDC